MPPSGFSQPAINGLLTFVRDAYVNTLDKYRGRDLSEEAALKESISYLEGYVERSVGCAVDGTVSREGIKGLQAFVTTNFIDLIQEIHDGKKQKGKAMEAEIQNIGDYLIKFKL